ncbi:MAG: exodeoxyribonuclease VII small subunit [Oscillospiraceae bacterium]|nr:exodeoxyribonuclease VII small subunit [Oscillospiraceae bacterium]MBQ6851013.1 exodeoxyribonuclease VII small subunit [Oscillospiraceae bacterium]MBR6609381.1 exodeoxyribonuclease VII small subunit [Oscillospiraceae bacterium]
MKQTFESAMARLEEISEILAENNVTLDESLKLYAEGVKLLKFCNSKLEQAQIKIRDIEGNPLEVE